ncbi:MAG: PilN domain-containing protein [Candidatus Omnitrophica bacterium]|nr:PilN domain-containing protein [Candidatus Omnitrophota bacterium]
MSFFHANNNLFVQADEKYLKLAQFSSTGKACQAMRLIVKPVSGLSEADMPRAFAEAVASSAINFNCITAVIPRQKVITRHIKLPAVNRVEIDKMLSFEIAKQTPYSQEDIISDYRIIGTDEQGYSRILLVISLKSELTRIDSLLGAYSSRLKQVYFSSEADAGWLDKAGLGPGAEESTCLVNVDADRTEIAVVSSSGLCFSRSITLGADDLLGPKTTAVTPQARLLDEIKQSMALCLKEKEGQGNGITKIILTGAAVAGEVFLDCLKADINISSSYFNSLYGVRLSDNALSESGIPENASVCSVCGAACMGFGINLMPQSRKQINRKRSLFKKLVAGFSLLFFACVVFFTVYFVRIDRMERTLEDLEALYSRIDKTSDLLEIKLKRLQGIKSYLAQGESSLDVIYNLYYLIPEGISLADFDYEDESKILRFSGKASKMSDVFGLVSLMESSEVFSNVQTGSVIQRQTKDGVSVDFQLRCNFKAVPERE